MKAYIVDGSKQNFADTIISLSSSGRSCVVSSFGFGVRQVRRLLEHFDSVNLVADGTHSQLNSKAYKEVVRLSNSVSGFSFTPKKIHAKLAVIDSEVVVFTSANLSANRRIEVYVVGSLDEIQGVGDIVDNLGLSLENIKTEVFAQKQLELSAAQLSEALGITVARVGQLSKEGVIAKLSSGRYSLSAVRQYMDTLKTGKAKTYTEKIDKEKYRQLKRQNDIEEGLHAPVELLVEALEKVSNSIVTNLENLHLLIKRRYPEVTADQMLLVRQAIAECRNTIAETKIDVEEE